MREERVRETKDHRFYLIMLLFLIFFSLQFMYSAFALVNYYHINSDRGRIAEREGDCFLEQWARKQANERGEGDAMLEACSEMRVKPGAGNRANEITRAELRCCQRGLWTMCLNWCKGTASHKYFKDEKRREEKRSILYQEVMLTTSFAAAWAELQG